MEAKLMASSLPARILAQKTIKYFSVASTIRRPQRLDKLPNVQQWFSASEIIIQWQNKELFFIIASVKLLKLSS